MGVKKFPTNLKSSPLDGAFLFLTYTLTAKHDHKQFSVIAYDRNIKEGVKLEDLFKVYATDESKTPYLEEFTSDTGALGAAVWQDNTKDIYYTGIFGQAQLTPFSGDWPYKNVADSPWKNGLVFTYMNQNKQSFTWHKKEFKRDGAKGLLIGSADPITSISPSQFMRIYRFPKADLNLMPDTASKYLKAMFEKIELKWIATHVKNLSYNGTELTDD